MRRDRICPKGHEYPTYERIAPHDFLRTTKISGPGGMRHYVTDRLQSDLSLKLATVLSKEVRNDVVEEVEKTLVQDWRRRKAPTELSASTISQAVVTTLRSYSDRRSLTKRVADSLRRAHVLYALSQESLRFTQGEQESIPLSGDGFDALPDILRWLADQYPKLRQAATRPIVPHYTGTPRIDRWHTLRGDAGPHPKTILRRVPLYPRDELAAPLRDTTPTGQDPSPTPPAAAPTHGPADEPQTASGAREWEAVPFDYQVYEKSVRRVFAGRDQYEHQTRYTTQWVLFALAGQETIRMSDLVAMTTQCLRRVDAVASLRWAIIEKNLTPAALVAEILGMIEWPAPRLRFESDAAADMRTSEQLLPLDTPEEEPAPIPDTN